MYRWFGSYAVFKRFVYRKSMNPRKIGTEPTWGSEAIICCDKALVVSTVVACDEVVQIKGRLPVETKE